MAGFVIDADRLAPREPAEFQPCLLSADPDEFGQSVDPLVPAEGVDPADARFLAANLQHWISNAVREGILLGRTNLVSLLTTLEPTSPEMHYDRILRVQRGQEVMTMADMVVWANQFESVRSIITAMIGDALR